MTVFNHITTGILLIPLALTTLYIARGVKKGQHWSRVVSLINGTTIARCPLFSPGWWVHNTIAQSPSSSPPSSL
ncbi:MAG: hypothetical protein AAB393_03145 [Bacteroidota bacterium]